MAEDEAGAAAALLALCVRRRALRQLDVADAVGVSQSQMSKMLRGQRPFTVQQYIDACRFIGVDPCEILHEAGASQ